MSYAVWMRRNVFVTHFRGASVDGPLGKCVLPETLFSNVVAPENIVLSQFLLRVVYKEN